MRTLVTVTALLVSAAASAQSPAESGAVAAQTADEEVADVIEADDNVTTEGSAVEAEVPPPAGEAPAGQPAAAGEGRFGEGSAKAGREKSATCAACHGADGNSFNAEWPSLAGQHARYLVRQLEAYQSGARQNVLMTPQAQNLSATDIRDLAAYFSSQKPQLRTADPKLARLGEHIYRGGNPETGVSACIACHGPTGSGNPAAGYALVRGQHATYIVSTLKAFAEGERRSDPNQIMRNIAVLLEDDETKAVAAYMQGLRTN